jgi:hypothetical protein|tara:strand:+ start:293 stop:562 length:270 start_codon:yes stop_codon:yes gene_type:complete
MYFSSSSRLARSISLAHLESIFVAFLIDLTQQMRRLIVFPPQRGQRPIHRLRESKPVANGVLEQYWNERTIIAELGVACLRSLCYRFSI